MTVIICDEIRADEGDLVSENLENELHSVSREVCSGSGLDFSR